MAQKQTPLWEALDKLQMMLPGSHMWQSEYSKALAIIVRCKELAERYEKDELRKAFMATGNFEKWYEENYLNE